MTEPAIDVAGVSKRYPRLGAEHPTTLKRAIIGGLRNIRASEWFWVLHEVDLRVPAGRIVGVIGRNGAGKSTLLRLVGGVGRPDSGAIRTRGRIGALLELGREFQPDLTGRENARLSGIIAGMTRRDAMQAIPRIVEFAELADFIDSPLRVFSSGMQARLAFAIATQIHSEVLLVDEVLAVGDANFRERCIAWLRQFRSDGGATLLVSHEPAAVRSLCDDVVWIDHGRVLAIGPAPEIVGRYMRASTEAGRPPTPAAGVAEQTAGGATLRLNDNRFGTQEGVIRDVVLLDQWGSVTGVITHHGELRVSLHASRSGNLGVRILRRADELSCIDTSVQVPSAGRVSLALSRIDLTPGEYAVSVGLYSADWQTTYDFHHAAYPLLVAGSDGGPREAVVDPPVTWHVEP